MTSLVLSRPVLGFIVGTRAALGFGIGLLVAGRIPEERRRRLALTMIGIGAATTIPAVMTVFGKQHEAESAQREVAHGSGF